MGFAEELVALSQSQLFVSHAPPSTLLVSLQLDVVVGINIIPPCNDHANRFVAMWHLFCQKFLSLLYHDSTMFRHKVDGIPPMNDSQYAARQIFIFLFLAKHARNEIKERQEADFNSCQCWKIKWRLWEHVLLFFFERALPPGNFYNAQSCRLV